MRNVSRGVASRRDRSCQATGAEEISIAKKLNDTNALAIALGWAAGIAYSQRDPAEADRLASDLSELATRHDLVYFLNISAIGRGWARSASGNTAEGIPWNRAGNKRLSGNRFDAGHAVLSRTKG